MIVTLTIKGWQDHILCHLAKVDKIVFQEEVIDLSLKTAAIIGRVRKDSLIGINVHFDHQTIVEFEGWVVELVSPKQIIIKRT
jgi:hypothetical protein